MCGSVSVELDTIVCGDCLDVMRDMPDGCMDLVVTDPPYGENQAKWDIDKPSIEIWDEMYRVLKEGGCLYYWGFWGHADWVLSNAKRVQLIPQSRIVWWFRTGRPEKKSFREDTENAWYFSKGEPRAFNAENYLEPYEDKANYRRYGRNGKHPGTVWIHSRVLHNHPGNVGHPTQKPEFLISKMVGISSQKGELIFDPFIGSGTTAVAALKLGRHFYGCDINPEYVKLANQRIEKTRLEMSQMELAL